MPSAERNTFEAAIGSLLRSGARAADERAVVQIEAALQRPQADEDRLRWLWAASCLLPPARRAQAAEEGLRAAQRRKDRAYVVMFTVNLAHARAEDPSDQGRVVRLLERAADAVRQLPARERDALLPDLVQGWLAVPSASARRGLPGAVERLAMAINGDHLAYPIARAQALILLANGILECRHVQGAQPDLRVAVLAAQEALRLAPGGTAHEANARLQFANALCLAETDDPVATLQHAQKLAEGAGQLRSGLGYGDAAERTAISWLTITRKLVSIRRDPAPELPTWVEAYLSAVPARANDAKRGAAALAVAQYYLDDAVRGDWRARGRAEEALDDALVCRPLSLFPLEAMVALAHRSALTPGVPGDRMLAEAKGLAAASGVAPLEYYYLLERALSGEIGAVRGVVDRAEEVLRSLPPSDTALACQLLEVVGVGRRRQDDLRGSLDAFRRCLEGHDALVAQAGSPVERAERVAAAGRVADETYRLLLELGLFAEALDLVERSKLRAHGLGAALRQGALVGDAGRRLSRELIEAQRALEALPISRFAERAAQARSLREVWRRLDKAAADAAPTPRDQAGASGTMVVVRATDDGGFAHLLPNHLVWDERDSVVPLPGFTREKLRGWLRRWEEDLCRPTDRRARAGRPADRTLSEIAAELGNIVFGPVVEAARGLDLDLRVVTVVPSGGLAVLPLQTARVDGGCLADVGLVRVAPSVGVWRAAMLKADRLTLPVARVFRGFGIEGLDLRSVSAELCAIARLFPPSAAGVELVEEGSVDDLRRALEGSRFVHVSGHGETVGVGDPARAGLSLGGSAVASARDLLSLDLDDTRLVSLSACQSAYHQALTSPDEFLGPAFALLAARSSAVTAALWNIDEIAATLFHVQMYRLLADGAEPIAAHGGAVTWIRGAAAADLLSFAAEHGLSEVVDGRLPVRGTAPFGSPQHWGSFVYIGH
ncbi:CHAT domain-containing protein [Pararoseomonas indoligenes]|uniref:CHAT domain-containing protein n=1 Tax=Roseomonas indoligenes TaxID=2820811 RepID=A0A940N5B9_9PROT|nr:CHAT domain-containing protein [Pararoseomonas indoligenes]MBP0496261.1 CHAT domain-containing protein [Pararoseomonas indoligenes]